MPPQGGLLEPVTTDEAGGPFTIAGIFGKNVPRPLILSNGADANYLEAGGHMFGVAPMSGVVTQDGGPGAMGAAHMPHAKNLLAPMHSEAFWVLLIGLAALGLFSASGGLKLGPIHFGANVGK